jgi:hypothetical protein
MLHPSDIRRVLEVTDSLGLHREAVRIPLDTVPGGRLRVAGSAMILELPSDIPLDTWLAELPALVPKTPGYGSLRRADTEDLA